MLRLGPLIARHEAQLGLTWRAAEDTAASRHLDPEAFPAGGIVGLLNPVRAPAIQVLGAGECAYLDTMPGAREHLFALYPACVIVAEDLTVDASLVAAAMASDTPLLAARAATDVIISELRADVEGIDAPGVSLHGVFIEVLGVGVLLTGGSGVGKSELGLELVSRGHRLIADDAPRFRRLDAHTVEGHCPPELENFMEVRGMGIVNVRAMYGDSAVKRQRYLRLIVNLEAVAGRELAPDERLYGIRRYRQVLTVPIPEITLPVAPGRNLAVLTECAVRNHILRVKGYEAARDLEQRQAHAMVGPRTGAAGAMGGDEKP